MFCPKCGARLADGTKFCPKCGCQISSKAKGQTPRERVAHAAETPQASQQAAVPKKGHALPVVIGIVAVAAVAVVVAFVLGVPGRLTSGSAGGSDVSASGGAGGAASSASGSSIDLSAGEADDVPMNDAQRALAITDGYGVAVDEDSLFYVTSAGVVMRVSLDGGEPYAIFTIQGDPIAMSYKLSKVGDRLVYMTGVFGDGDPDSTDPTGVQVRSVKEDGSDDKLILELGGFDGEGAALYGYGVSDDRLYVAYMQEGSEEGSLELKVTSVDPEGSDSKDEADVEFSTGADNRDPYRARYYVGDFYLAGLEDGHPCIWRLDVDQSKLTKIYEGEEEDPDGFAGPYLANGRLYFYTRDSEGEITWMTVNADGSDAREADSSELAPLGTYRDDWQTIDDDIVGNVSGGRKVFCDAIDIYIADADGSNREDLAEFT